LGFFFVTPAAVFPSNIVAGRLFSFAVNQRRFPPPWSVEDIGGCFGVKTSNDRPLLFIHYEEGVGRRFLARLLTRDAARRIAAGRAKLPELLKRA
jgi:hypothetical protein